jgi:hypothetical protein
MEKVLAQSHGGFAGASILELLEAELTEVCTQYLVLKEAVGATDGIAGVAYKDRERIAEARGRIRGVAISIAMMRHPLRRGELVWWNYVKKLEKRHVGKAKEAMPSPD